MARALRLARPLPRHLLPPITARRRRAHMPRPARIRWMQVTPVPTPRPRRPPVLRRWVRLLLIAVVVALAAAALLALLGLLDPAGAGSVRVRAERGGGERAPVDAGEGALHPAGQQAHVGNAHQVLGHPPDVRARGRPV